MNPNCPDNFKTLIETKKGGLAREKYLEFICKEIVLDTWGIEEWRRSLEKSPLESRLV